MKTYNVRTICRLCNSNKIKLLLDFGLMPLAGGFIHTEDIPFEKKFPLRLFFCEKCALVQVVDIIPQEILFRDYRYTSSTTKTLSEHFRDYAKDIQDKFLDKNSFVVEIGSNDGVLLSPLKELNVNALGVEPASNIVSIATSKGLKVLNDFFNVKTAREVVNQYGLADAILANNVLAHIDDMNGIIEGIKILLNKDGVLIFEVQYFLDLVKDLQYDFIYHEHMSYYTIKPLIKFFEKHGMKIFDVKDVSIHGGSIRVYVTSESNKKYKILDSVKIHLQKEEDMGLHTFSGLSNFSQKVKIHRDKLVKILNKFKSEGKKICGYGASGRSVTLTNYCNIGQETLEYIIDSSPERYGRVMPGTHVKIMSPEYLKLNKADVMLILAWTYLEEILKKEQWFWEDGREGVVPFPNVAIITKEDICLNQLA